MTMQQDQIADDGLPADADDLERIAEDIEISDDASSPDDLPDDTGDFLPSDLPEREQRERTRRRRSGGRDIDEPPFEGVIDEGGDVIPIEELPSSEERRERLEDERIEEEQLQQRISARKRRGEPFDDLLDPDELRYTQRLGIEEDDLGEPIESIVETRAEREFRLGQESARADVFGGGIEGERLSREDTIRFNAASAAFQQSIFSSGLQYANVLDAAGIPEREQAALMAEFVQRQFRTALDSAGVEIGGDIPIQRAESIARDIIDADRERDVFEANNVQGAQGQYITRQDFDSLSASEQQIFLNEGLNALNRSREFGQITVDEGIFVGGAGEPVTGGLTQGPPPESRIPPTISYNLDTTNQDARADLNDAEYFDFLVITGQGDEAIRMARESGVALTLEQESELIAVIADSPFNRMLDDAYARLGTFNPREGQFGILDPRFALPQSALAGEIAASVLAYLRSRATQTGTSLGQAVRDLRNLQFRPSGAIGSGPMLPTITRRVRPANAELSDASTGLPENVRREIEEAIGEGYARPFSVETSTSFQRTFGRTTDITPVTTTPSVVPATPESIARFNRQQEQWIEAQRAVDSLRNARQREQLTRLLRESIEERELVSAALRRTATGQIVTASGAALDAETSAFVRSLAITSSQLQPLASPAPATIAVPQQVQTVRAEGEGQILPSIGQEPVPESSPSPIFNPFEQGDAPRPVTPGTPVTPQPITATPQPITATPLEPTPRISDLDRPITQQEIFVSPQIAPTTGIAEQTRTGPLPERAILPYENPEDAREIPEEPEDVLEILDEPEPKGETPRTPPIAQPLTPPPTRGAEDSGRPPRPDIDLDLEEEGVEAITREGVYPQLQGFRRDLQDDEDSEDDNLYVYVNRATGETQFSTEPEFGVVPTVGPDESESLRTIQTGDEERPERVIQVGDKTYALTDDTLSDIDSLERDIGRPLTERERQLMALSTRTDDASVQIEEQAEDREENRLFEDADRELDAASGGREFSFGGITAQMSSGAVRLRNTHDIEAERERRRERQAINDSAFSKRLREIQKRLDVNRRRGRG